MTDGGVLSLTAMRLPEIGVLRDSGGGKDNQRLLDPLQQSATADRFILRMRNQDQGLLHKGHETNMLSDAESSGRDILRASMEERRRQIEQLFASSSFDAHSKADALKVFEEFRGALTQGAIRAA